MRVDGRDGLSPQSRDRRHSEAGRRRLLRVENLFALSGLLATKGIRAVFVGSLTLPILVAAQTSLSVGNVPGCTRTTVAVPVTLRQGGSAVATQVDVAFNRGKVSALEALRGERR